MSAATTFGALPIGARFRLLPAGGIYRKIAVLEGAHPLHLAAEGGEDRDGRAIADDRTVYPVSDAEYLEYLRGEIRAERLSYGELADLQDMAELIDPGDVELLEWAGVPEHPEPRAWEITVVLHAEGETPADALAAWIADNGAENLPIQSATEEDA